LEKDSLRKNCRLTGTTPEEKAFGAGSYVVRSQASGRYSANERWKVNKQFFNELQKSFHKNSSLPLRAAERKLE